jgi:hypothetical protein
MRKAEVLRLKPGQYVCWADTNRGSSRNRPTPWGNIYEGEVVFVTEKGGVRVRERKSGEERWIPYHHVYHTKGTVWWREQVR